MKNISNITRKGSQGIAFIAFVTAGFAEPVDSTAPTATTPADTVVLDKFEVKEVPGDEQIMPTVRPISSVMGDSRNILDTPRSVSSVNKDLMHQVNIKSVTDLQQFSPGVYTASRYGIATTPGIRGDLAAVYIDGQRAKYSRNSVMPSFNGVESIDIVKGPGSAVYGPQSNDAAGYINFVTKQPYFDKQHTELSVSYAGVTSDRNYSNVEYSIDNSGPISDKTAYRVSYLGRSGDGYYQNTTDRTQDLFFALTHRFSDTLTLDWWIQGYDQTYDQVSGINHVTQDLIDHSIYVGATTIKIDPYQSVVGKLDYMTAQRLQSQFVLTKEFTPDTSLKNLSYGETRNSENYTPSENYSEYVPTDWNLQNRTEYHFKFDLGSVENSVITGIDLKYERMVAYQTFFNEDYGSQDLTLSSSTWSNLYPNIGEGFGSAHSAVPGHTKFGSDLGHLFGNNPGGNQDSKLGSLGLFYQHDAKLTKELSAIAGLRYDHVYADVKSPEYVDRSTNTRFAAGNLYDQDGSVDNVSYYLSSLYKLTPKQSVYVTYDATYAVQGGANFGGVNMADNSNAALEQALQSKATLLELGYKFVAFDNKLYNTVTLYEQERRDPDKFGKEYKRLSKGFEYEAVFQPNKNLSFLGNYTYQTVTRESTTGVETRYPGTPRWLLNGRVNYKFDSGFGFGGGPQIIGPQQADSLATLSIPVQYTINGNVFYAAKNWDVQINFINLTNQANWAVVDPDYFDYFTGGVIYRERPFSSSVTMRYRF